MRRCLICNVSQTLFKTPHMKFMPWLVKMSQGMSILDIHFINSLATFGAVVDLMGMALGYRQRPKHIGTLWNFLEMGPHCPRLPTSKRSQLGAWKLMGLTEGEYLNPSGIWESSCRTVRLACGVWANILTALIG